MRNQNIDVERQQEEIDANQSWYHLPRSQKLELIGLIVTRSDGRLELNGRSVKDASHKDLIQEAQMLNYALDLEDLRIRCDPKCFPKPRKKKTSVRII